MQIINLSEINAEWCWLKNDLENDTQKWLHCSSVSNKYPAFLKRPASITRVLSAAEALITSKFEHSILVSHGPRPAFFAGFIANYFAKHLPHLVYSFNFTDLPVDRKRQLMIKAFKHPKKFVTYSSYEQKLYSDYFEIPPELIDMVRLSLHHPETDKIGNPIEQGDYICAMGSQGRDYQTLFNAIKPLKHIKLVLVASPSNLQNLNTPENVKVYTNIALNEAHNILFHSKFMVVPLRDQHVPCGHVTIVFGMFFKKAMIVTDSIGVSDYVYEHETGLLHHANDATHLRSKIERLWDDHVLRASLEQNAYQFATRYCTEKNPIDYFNAFMKQYG